MERIAILDHDKIKAFFDDPNVSWHDKENWLYFYFQKGQLRLSEYLELREELDNIKSKWLEEK